MKDFIKKLIKEIIDKLIVCKNCGWSWKESESSKKDLYICHKCWLNNEPYYIDKNKKN
jgi:DNA-directed RNA polymerase subunit RPC12/RpoP